jgi:carbonic anhydrase
MIDPDTVPPAIALRRLRAGNARFTGDTCRLTAADSRKQLADHAASQRPFAIILTCADSRVPAEMIFDHGIGDLFVIRVAGNIIAPSLVGSAEFAVGAFGTRLLVVMGHSGCGAVRATLDTLRGAAEAESENIRDIVSRIAPPAQIVLDVAGEQSDDQLLRAAIRANVRWSAGHLRHGSTALEKIAVVGAEYNLETGVVEFFDVPKELAAELERPVADC